MSCTAIHRILIFSLINILLISRACCRLLQPTVHIEMDEAGMHRKLKYTIQCVKPLTSMDCEYMLFQPLPAAVYISTDELDDLLRLEMLSAIYPKFVDIEIITENAKPFSVLLRGSPKLKETLTLPIHFRYHAASVKRSNATVVITTPKLYLNCAMGDNELIDTELLPRPDKLYCLNAQNSRFEERSNLHPETADDCNWQELQVEYELKTPLQAEIPVGNANGYTPVLYATIALSWAVSIWTVLRTQSVPRRINKQLNEQRLLQQHKVKAN